MRTDPERRFDSNHKLRILLACAGFLLPWAATAADGIVGTGAGSYTTVLPADCEPLPGRIYKSGDLKGPTVTGQWWSSLLFQQFSNNIFAHPLGMVCAPGGLAICYPGAAIVSSEAAIMGGGVTADGDFRIGHSAMANFPDARCSGYSDWFVTAEFASGDASLRASFGHGSPFVYCVYRAGDPVLTFSEVPRILSGKADTPVLGITVKGNHYGLFGATGTTWSLDGKVFTNKAGGKGYFSVALLPDAKPETLAMFQRHAYNHVTDTHQEHEVAGGKVRTRYRFTFKPWQGEDNGTIFALYPHQWKYSKTPLTGMSYASVRGAMKIAEGSGFDTETVVQGVLPMFPVEGVKNRERMSGYLKTEATAPPPAFLDTYWEGKYLGRLVSLSGIAEVSGAADLQKRLVDEIKRRLENWFTASADETAPLFHYNANWGSLIGSKPSYGSDKSLNDHHFHYGYFIRAAAEIARLDPQWATQWGPMVNLLVRDIASPDRADPMFPFLRCFDKYAGHSWASGDANFADGNNQESSSESMNAWYALTLWGEASGDHAIRDTGIYLFNTERTAVEEYWFDVSGTNFPKDFKQVALGMVWGGKGAFGTWFSGEIDCIHGINWLPFTPASIYMGRHPDYVKKNYDRIVSRRQGGTDFSTGWGDLVVMFGALADPARAATWFDAHPDCKLEGGNTHAFMDQWIGILDQLGTNDASVFADSPFTNVFIKNGKRSYVAYNFGSRPVMVKFSDGNRLEAAPKKLTLLGEKP